MLTQTAVTHVAIVLVASLLIATMLVIIGSLRRRCYAQLPGPPTEVPTFGPRSRIDTHVQSLCAGEALAPYLEQYAPGLALSGNFRDAFRLGDADQGAGYRSTWMQLQTLQEEATSAAVMAAFTHPFSTLAGLRELTRVVGEEDRLTDVPAGGHALFFVCSPGGGKHVVGCRRQDAAHWDVDVYSDPSTTWPVGTVVIAA